MTEPMDRHTLHEASRAAGRFQRLALAHLDRRAREQLTEEGQALVDLLDALGFRPTRTEKAAA